ncbi:DUF1996 domain-containing protein [Paractinoplanes lichenicola]|uniref:DUF1996 domain-containing protein n=1 Tax=Paractinoplanes lichenicola TaxID=2802976 RepID=A0ABS1VEH5_9ACTN|nr:DUF1996 domain-containing protein [Actinoplanes lichenicola]MBL7253084.1 DUF1996 domain-containing protein [Actinoplanes lichenicola]
MRTLRTRRWQTPARARAVRVGLAAAVLAATGALTVTFVSGGGQGSADAATRLSDYVPIEDVRANVVTPKPGPGAATGRFTVDCGVNRNGKFSPDNPVAQPGIRNGAEHLHDFVGNQAITADSSDADLAAGGTTCRNGDKSSYFWPVVRIDRSVRAGDDTVRQALANTSGSVVCPSVRSRMPAVPVAVKAAVDRRLAELDRAEVAANRRVLAVRGMNLQVNGEVLQGLRAQRSAAFAEIGDLIRSAGGRRPAGLVSLTDCDVSYDAIHASLSHGSEAGSANAQVRCPNVRDQLPGVPRRALAEVDRALAQLDRQVSVANQRLVAGRTSLLGPLRASRAAVLDRIAAALGRPGSLNALAGCSLDQRGDHPGAPPSSAPTASPTVSPSAPSGAPTASPTAGALPDPQGPNRELPGNTGTIVRPASVLIEYRGNPAGQVVAMPRFLRALTGDAKPTSRGPANARATWSCSGFADRLADRYPICPAGSRVQRVQDFPGCWDGRNTDSANHRDHLAFADRAKGACPQGFVAVPQLRITISYDIPRDVQTRGQYALDSFPEEDHNPFSDHNDFVNVNSTRTMNKIVTCLNRGATCRF